MCFYRPCLGEGGKGVVWWGDLVCGVLLDDWAYGGCVNVLVW